MEGWIKVYSSDSQVQVEIAKSILLENNIDSIDVSKKDSSYVFGEIELYVQENNAIISRLVLTQNNL